MPLLHPLAGGRAWRNRPQPRALEQAFDYIRRTPEIRDVLLSGGDPLFLSDDRLDWILTQLRSIPHVEFIRLGTKMPAVLPQRITRELCRVLKQAPSAVDEPALHPSRRVTPETVQACTRLADAGIPLGSQTVLLRGVNDNVPTMKDLMHGLLKMRVRPYYLYQCDPITGSSHFRTPVAKGLGNHRGAAWAHHRLRRADLCDRRPGRRRQDPARSPTTSSAATATTCCCATYEGGVYRYPDPEA